MAAWGTFVGVSHGALIGSWKLTVLTLVRDDCQALVEWLVRTASRCSSLLSLWLLWFSLGRLDITRDCFGAGGPAV